MEAIAEASGVALVSVEIHGEADLESALAAMSRDRPDALWVHIAVSPYRTRIVEHAAVHRLPAADGASVAARDHGSVLSRRLGPAL
jgi:citrate lyase beta subunit